MVTDSILYYEKPEEDWDSLLEKVDELAKKKGIFERNTPIAIGLKTMEKGQKLYQSLSGEREDIEIYIGEVIMFLEIQAKIHDLDLLNCLKKAYERGL